MKEKIKSAWSKGEGRHGPWSEEQESVLDEFLPQWHQFSVITNKELEGNHPVITHWKKSVANTILQRGEFDPSKLPEGVSLQNFAPLPCTDALQLDVAQARQKIVKKFTNYRYAHKENSTNTSASNKALAFSDAASAYFIDVKSYSKGKSLFREQNQSQINLLRDKLMEEGHLPRVAADQKAVRLLWSEADQGMWEARAFKYEDSAVYT